MSTELNTETTPDPDQTALDVAQAERLRCAGIVAECKNHPQIAEQAISEGWTPAKAALEVLRAGYPTSPGTVAYQAQVRDELQAMRDGRAKAPAIGTPRRINNRDFLECALALNAGTPEDFVAEHYGEQLMDAALTPQGRRIGIHDVLRAVCAQVGEQLHPGRLTASDIKRAFQADLQLKASGFSTISIPGILGNVTGKSLLSAYQAANSVARRIARSASLPDFKAGHTAYRLTGSGMIEEVGKGGELKHSTVREDSYTNQLSTFGKMLQITRTDIINDDLNAFGEIPRIFGRQTALAVEDKLFTLLLANTGSFFGTGNLNYQEGAATNLQLSSLDSLMQKFMDQVDNDGKPVLISPAILLVPTTLAATARQLISSLELVGNTTTDTLKPSGNPFSKTLEVLTSPYLNNTSYTGYSTKAWYLFASPGDVAALEIAYLNGVQSPTIETAEADFNTLGIQMRVFFDFGIAFQDPRAAAKSKGEA